MKVNEAAKLVREAQTRHETSRAKIHEFQKKVKLAEARANAAKLQFKEAKKSAKQAKKNRKIALQQASLAEGELNRAVKKLEKAQKKAHKRPASTVAPKSAGHPRSTRKTPATAKIKSRASRPKKSPPVSLAPLPKVTAAPVPMLVQESGIAP